ncbi:MAG: hypothetical protein KDC98_07460 [Planctomycetes bacterium]|nr:hypothetical protein [Planctomycetota bacterium]
MLRPRCFTSLIVLGLSACATAPMPDGIGRGVIAFDPEPPPAAVLYERPACEVGCRYALLQGGQIRQEFTVVESGTAGQVVRDASGHELRRDRDLGHLGEWNAEGEAVHLLSPADARFHWPLWVGKRWRCEYVDRRPGEPMRTLEVSYTVEELDRIAVPAGTFEALRIARVAVLKADGGRYLSRTSLSWYAPSIGLEVRQVRNDTAFELLEWSPGQR